MCVCVSVFSCQQNWCGCKGLTFPSSHTQDCCGMQTEDILFICGSQVLLFDLNAIFLDCLCCGCWEHRDGRSRASPPCPWPQQRPVADAEGRHHGGRRATRPRQIPRSPGIWGSRRCGSSSGPLAALDLPWELLPSAQLLSESGFTAGLGCAGTAGAVVLFSSLLLPFPQLLLCLAQQLCGCRESQGSTLLQSQGSTLLQPKRTLRQYPC